MSTAITSTPAGGPAATREKGLKGLPGMRSTALRHLLLMVLAYVGVVLLLKTLDPFRASQMASVAYFIPAVAGLTVLTGLNGQISLGHGALMAVGAYTAAVLLERAPGLPFVVVVLGAVLVTALVGVVVGAAAARLHGPYLAGATLALAVGVPGLAIYFEDLLGGEQGLRVRPPQSPDWFEQLTGATSRTYLAYLGWALALVVLFLLSNLLNSRVGRQWRAVRDNEVAAQLAGIDLGRSRVVAFVVSAACAGVAGALYACVIRLAAPGSFTLVLSLSLLTAIVIGGLGSLLGAVIGSVLLVFLAPFLTDRGAAFGLSDIQSANVAPLVYGLVLVLLMLIAPRGLVGTVRLKMLQRQTAGLRAAQRTTELDTPAQGTPAQGTPAQGTGEQGTGHPSTGDHQVRS